MKIRYMIYNPAGNITALVIGDKYTAKQRKMVNDKIMKIEPTIEQVGFLSEKKYKLTMAGEEFCGNALRCAAFYYMKNNNKINIEINSQIIKCGRKKEEIWCEIPINCNSINKLDEQMYKLNLKDITIVTIKKDLNDNFNKNNIKQFAKRLINKYKIDNKAVGVMIYSYYDEKIILNPIVWVKEIDTLCFENACGSGSIGVAIVENLFGNKNKLYRIIQPSTEILKIKLNKIEKNYINITLSGKIYTDNIIREINI